MEIVVWMILGVFAGGIVAIAMKDEKKMIRISDIVLGVTGALLAGFFTNIFTLKAFFGLYDESVFVIVIGAGMLIWIGRTIIVKSS